MKIGFPAQPTDFSLDVLGRYVCNTFDEAKAASEPPSGGRPFDFIIVGGGTFGSALAEHLWFRSIGRSERVLVLDAGPFLIPEHVQNLPAIGLDAGDAVSHHQAQKEVWGLAWNGNVKFPGLAYCVGGRSLYWGGWSPRLLDAETPADLWPQALLDDLNADTLPSGDPGYFRQASDQIGVTETNDYVFGDLHNAMRAQLRVGLGTVGSAISLSSLPDHPAVRFSPLPPTADELLKLLGLPPNPSPPPIQDLRDELKLEAPLAVQGQPGHAGYFPFNKFSAVPLLTRAARDAFREAPGNDANKRLMVVPRCHVSRLNTVPDTVGVRVSEIMTEYGPITVAPDSKVVIALGTVESTRLALESFGSDGRTGTNLMAHLRSNVDIRVPRTALAGLPTGLKALQVSALFVKGRHKFKDSNGNEDGTVGHFHLQITASGLGSDGTDSEAELFKKIPDIDLFEQHLQATDTHVVITIRAVGEMQRMNPSCNVTLDLDPNQTDYGARRAYVNLNFGPKDRQLWNAMDVASDQVAKIFAGGLPFEILIRGKGVPVNAGTDLSQVLFYLPKDNPDPNKPGRRDGLGTTHHEAGTLWMGTDGTASVVNSDCRFHKVSNAYVAGPAVFPSIGSPNPMLTGIAMARRLGDHLVPAPPPATPAAGFTYLFDGSEPQADLFSRWKMVGQGGFDKVGRTLVARPGNGIGLLFYAVEKFDNFILRLDFLLPHPRGPGNDNSGVFVRFRDPRLQVPANYPPPNVPGNDATVAVDTGYEIQIDEEARGDTRISEADGLPFNHTGAIYKIRSFGTGAGQQDYQNAQRLRSERWHRLEIEVSQNDFIVRLNGVASTHFRRDPGELFRGHPPSADPDSGFIGLQSHTGQIAFANIALKKL